VSTCELFGGSTARATPHTCGVDARLPHDGLFMVAYLQQLCNSSPARAPQAWQGPWTDGWCLDHPPRGAGASRTLGPTRPACLQRSLQAAGVTCARLSAPPPHVMGTYPSPQRSAACRRWTLRSGRVYHQHAQTQRRQRHMHGMDSVVWGETAPWFGEKQPRGLRRNTPWFGEKHLIISPHSRKDCGLLDCKEDCREDHTHHRVCQA
jgi:hypothetical protein